MPVAGHADQFVNGAFEDGTLNGWTQGGGLWFGDSYPSRLLKKGLVLL
jgi:hypothetical protein